MPQTLLNKIAVVFIGGGIGCLLRYFISLCFNKANWVLPIHTFLANIIACFAIGLIVSVFALKSDFSENVKLFLTVGFCGGLSTMSTFSFEVVDFILDNNYIAAGCYTVVSIVLCVVAAILGLTIGGFIGQRV